MTSLSLVGEFICYFRKNKCGSRTWVSHSALMASVRAAADNALQCARRVCLAAHMMKPDISRSAWPQPSERFQFDFDLENDIEVIDPDHGDGGFVNDHTLEPSESGLQRITPHEAEFQARRLDDANTAGPATVLSPQPSDEAGPATTLHSRFNAMHVERQEPTLNTRFSSLN